MLKALIALAAVALTSIPVLAQSDTTLNKGQVLRILPTGKFSVGAQNMDSKMQSAMIKRGKKMPKGLVVWMDEKGQVFYSDQPVDASSMK